MQKIEENKSQLLVFRRVYLPDIALHSIAGFIISTTKTGQLAISAATLMDRDQGKHALVATVQTSVESYFDTETNAYYRVFIMIIKSTNLTFEL